MKFARSLLIFSYGLFTIAAQALLFREFLTAFEGNDIAVGVFFACWFLWISVGAILIAKVRTLANRLLAHPELAFLLYLPAFVLQAALIIQVRQIAGIEPYALLPMRTVLLLSLLVNAPVSLLTGVLFPIACRWVQQHQFLPISRVYLAEAAGSAAGGLAVTILLALGLNSVAIFFVLALVLSLSALIVRLSRVLTSGNMPHATNRTSPLVTGTLMLTTILFGTCLSMRFDRPAADFVQRLKWTKLLPKEAMQGSFQTPQAEYLYGTYQGQWVAVCQGSVCEALPDTSSAGQIAAMCLAQKPDARSVLVIGSGLGLCNEMLRLNQIERLAWAHTDAKYIDAILRHVPRDMLPPAARFSRIAGDIRQVLSGGTQDYDLAILNLPDATSSVLNRYFTIEFYRVVKRSLGPAGVLAVRISGGENIMGTELINLGASTRKTLEKVFANTLLVPGDQTWFLASDSNSLTANPAILRDRFAQIPGAADVLSPEALLSIYRPARAEAALQAYAAADLPDSLLVNRDARPLTHLYSLLLTARQSGAPVTRLIKHFALGGPFTFVIPLAVLVALRLLYTLRTSPRLQRSSFDSSFLVFSAGWVSIGVVVVLMYLYQTWFGSLYLHVGLISSLFMVGLTLAALLILHFQRQSPAPRSTVLLFVVLIAHVALLMSLALVPPAALYAASAEQAKSLDPMHLFFAAAFLLSGLCTGCYFPIAAAQLAQSDFETGAAAAKLENADHLGAALGAVVTSLILVPVLGTKAALILLASLIVANAPLAALHILKPNTASIADTTPLRLRRLGYCLFGIAAVIVLCSNVLAERSARSRPNLPRDIALALAGEQPIEQVSATPPDAGRKLSYFTSHDATGQLKGYIFSSADFAADVRGYGGKINLAIHTDPNGSLLNFHIVKSNETPAYLSMLAGWFRTLTGGKLFTADPLPGVNAVTGATVSSKAVLEALRTAGQNFASQVLNRQLRTPDKTALSRPAYVPDLQTAYLIGAFATALIVSHFGRFSTRLIVLALNLILGGLILNAQYSIEQIATLLSTQIPTLKLSAAFMLVVGIPLLVAVFGNLYCGYVCPFGAAQELLNCLLPARLRPAPTPDQMQSPRFIKYVTLFVLIVLFFLSRSRTTLAADPLISVFSLRSPVTRSILSNPMFVLLVAIAVGSLLYTRFWCRYLCPAGALLSLLNNIAPLKRILPPKAFARCEFGLTYADHGDCIQCDRCRRLPAPAKSTAPEKKTRAIALPSRFLLTGALAVAILLSAISADRFARSLPSSDFAAGHLASGGQPRDVDTQRVKALIEQNRLSNREAEFYRKLE
jgi:spermidine synthase